MEITENQIREGINKMVKENPNVEPYRVGITTQILNALVGQEVELRNLNADLDNPGFAIGNDNDPLENHENEFTVVVEEDGISVAEYDKEGNIEQMYGFELFDTDSAVKMIMEQISGLG